ncbi:MAG: hypothetical protein SNJ84_03125, partial [Verrucomicrobiia bacterium]
ASPDLLPELHRRLDPRWIDGLPGSELLGKMMDLFNNDLWHDSSTLLPHLHPEEQNLISRLGTEPLEDLPLEGRLADLERHCRNLGLNWLNAQIKLVGQQLRQPGLSPPQTEQLLSLQAELLHTRNRLTEATGASSL